MTSDEKSGSDKDTRNEPADENTTSIDNATTLSRFTIQADAVEGAIQAGRIDKVEQHFFELKPLKQGCLNKKAKSSEPENRNDKEPETDLESEIQDYCSKAEALHEKIPLAGFRTKVRVPILIEDIYVPLRAMIDDRLTGNYCFADAEDAEKRLHECQGGLDISVPDAFREADKRHRRGIVILGDPGSGKTTHLKRVLIWCLRNGLKDLGLPEDMVPVFLPLRDLKDVTQNLDDFIQDQLSLPNLDTPEGFGRKLLKRGHLLFLLDGLDEVSDTNHRIRVSRWIETAMAIHRTCRFVVTCRFAGYTEDARLNEDFIEMHMRPMTAEQAEKFVHNWYRIVETAHSSDSDQAKVIAKEKADKLVQRLRQPEFRARRVFELTRNPLLLTNICLVHLDRGNLPHTRVALYDECTDVLLERWHGAVGVRNLVTAQIGRKVLQPAAYWLHQKDGRTRATAEELSPVIEPVLKTVEWSHGSAAEFLKTVRDDSGILTGWDQEHYGFMHLGFQEYLAACEIRNKAFRNPELFRDLAGKLGKSWWQEVILLILALDNPSVFVEFMNEVVKLPVFAQHTDIIEMCLDDASEKSPQPFVNLVKMPPGKNKDMWERQLLALRIVERIDEGMVDKLLPVLETHPYDAIRQWAEDKRAEAGQDVIYSPGGGCELVRIPGGSFMMGSPESEEGRYERENPLHSVKVPTFYMGRYPVTNEEYGRFLADNSDMKEPGYWGDRELNQPRQPVVGVSWDDVKKFARWAQVILPSEAQWEYACRAGTQSRFYTGDKEEDLDRAGWYSKNSGGALHPVGEKEPNAFGLYDMHGNVYECVEDDFHDNYHNAPADGSAWVDDPRSSTRVIRGGCWQLSAGGCRAAYRNGSQPDRRNLDLGFRVALLSRSEGEKVSQDKK